MCYYNSYMLPSPGRFIGLVWILCLVCQFRFLIYGWYEVDANVFMQVFMVIFWCNKSCNQIDLVPFFFTTLGPNIEFSIQELSDIDLSSRSFRLLQYKIPLQNNERNRTLVHNGIKNWYCTLEKKKIIQYERRLIREF